MFIFIIRKPHKIFDCILIVITCIHEFCSVPKTGDFQQCGILTSVDLWSRGQIDILAILRVCCTPQEEKLVTIFS